VVFIPNNELLPGRYCISKRILYNDQGEFTVGSVFVISDRFLKRTIFGKPQYMLDLCDLGSQVQRIYDVKVDDVQLIDASEVGHYRDLDSACTSSG